MQNSNNYIWMNTFAGAPLNMIYYHVPPEGIQEFLELNRDYHSTDPGIALGLFHVTRRNSTIEDTLFTVLNRVLRDRNRYNVSNELLMEFRNRLAESVLMTDNLLARIDTYISLPDMPHRLLPPREPGPPQPVPPLNPMQQMAAEMEVDPNLPRPTPTVSPLKRKQN